LIELPQLFIDARFAGMRGFFVEAGDGTGAGVVDGVGGVEITGGLPTPNYPPHGAFS
jgi:hypothetical protein